METPIVLDRNGLLAAWRRLVPTVEGVVRDRYELDEFGEVAAAGCPSGTRQLAFRDIYCQLTDQMGHLAAMSVPVVTPSFGIRIPDVVWMVPEKWEGFDRDGPVPFIPDLCVEVLLDCDRPRDMDRRLASYLEGGAKEVIVVTPDGAIEFWGPNGRRQASSFAITLSVEPAYCQASVSTTAAGGQVSGDFACVLRTWLWLPMPSLWSTVAWLPTLPLSLEHQWARLRHVMLTLVRFCIHHSDSKKRTEVRLRK